MTDSYKEYLAAKVLTDGQPITYRLLSRALKVNVSIAKHMLYEFHAKQNAKKQNSVHATYLLTGRKQDNEHTNGSNNASGTDGADTIMCSSPPMSSMADAEEQHPEESPIPKTSVVLVREDELESVKQEFREIISVHVYSLEAGPIESLNLLATCNQQIATEYANEDPLNRWRTYGSIHNPYVKRRTAKFAPKPALATSKPDANPIAKPDAKLDTKSATKSNAASIFGSKKATALGKKEGQSEDNDSDRSTPQPAAATNTLKKSDSRSSLRKEKSDIFKSFAKAKPKAKGAEKSKESTPAEDEPMQGMSEDEGPEEEEEVKIDQEKQAAARKARAEREEKLRKMMEDDDEDMPDAPVEEEESASQDADADRAVEAPAAAETVSTEGGKRRGRRKVMKKKVQKDADGYLVTKEEAVWESFSEEEPAPKKPKPAPKPTNTAKGKKTAKGQGSIASFFKKA